MARLRNSGRRKPRALAPAPRARAPRTRRGAAKRVVLPLSPNAARRQRSRSKFGQRRRKRLGLPTRRQAPASRGAGGDSSRCALRGAGSRAVRPHAELTPSRAGRGSPALRAARPCPTPLCPAPRPRGSRRLQDRPKTRDAAVCRHWCPLGFAQGQPLGGGATHSEVTLDFRWAGGEAGRQLEGKAMKPAPRGPPVSLPGDLGQVCRRGAL